MDNYFRFAQGTILISVLVAMSLGIQTLITFSIIPFLLILSFCIYKLNQAVKTKLHLYEQIIDAVPHPISVTDINMNWIFVNKAATDPLGMKRADVIGQQCSNWGASICNTDKCGINCLRKGESTTFFNQWDNDFKVTSSYVKDLNGRDTGHIELVQNVSDKVVLKTFYSEMDKISKNLNLSVNDLNNTSNSLTSGSSHQAAAITQISGAVNEVLTQANDNANRSEKASEVTNETRIAAKYAAEEMLQLEGAMNEITQSSDAISEIINVIENIASQTNLLALNASIEAARAGETGRGFAVVADEVRQLAERSSVAAKDSAQHIESSILNVKRGNEISQKCVIGLKQIVDQVALTSNTIKEMNSASHIQAEGLEEINQAMEEIEQIAGSTTDVAFSIADTAKHTSVSSKALSGLASKLSEQLTDLDDIQVSTKLSVTPEQKMISIKDLS